MRTLALLLAAMLLVGMATAQAPAPGTPPAAAAAENLLRFDYHRVELRRQDDRWQLVANGQPLKDFPREAEARQALKLIHDLRLTQHGTVGSPQPVIEYWLSDGQAPRGLVRGPRLTPVDPNSVRAEQLQQQWCVRDDRQVHFQFGNQQEDARRAAEIIKRYEFNQVGFVGLDKPSMMYFLIHHNNKDAAQIVTPTSASAAPGGNRPQVVLPVGVSKPPPLGQAGKAGANPLTPAVQPFGARQLTSPALPSAPPAPAGVERVAFDWRRAELKRDKNDWKLVAGGATLAHFGVNEREARLALSVVQRYRFTEQYVVGKPKPACSYYLASGQPPRGIHFGVSSVSFKPEALTVHERNGTFELAEGKRTLMYFADEQDARRMLQVVQQHKFDHWCHVGRESRGGLTFFVKDR